MKKSEFTNNMELTSYKSFQDIYSYINAIPALFWSIDIIKNKIEYINKYALPGLGENSHFLIQNPEFAEQMIVEEDRYIFESFMKDVRNKKPGLAVFRIKLYDGTIRWFKISGSPDFYRSNYYVGYVMDISETAIFIRTIDNTDASMVKKINIFNNPVFLIAFEDKHIHACNSTAYKVFGLKQESLMSMTFENIVLSDMSQYLNSIYEEIIFSGHWRGELTFVTSSGTEFLSEASIRPLHVRGENLLWVSVYNMPGVVKKSSSGKAQVQAKEIDVKGLLRKITAAAKKGSMTDILDLILANQPIPGLANAVLYSDIHVDEGIVHVWGAGEAFKPLAPAFSHPYEGTIAENIVNYNLNHIIVENTFESIKPVDWAIFIPHGIKSYFAKPFFTKEKITTVLIFCSTERAVFNEENIRFYDPLYPAFENSLDIINRKKSGGK